MQFISNARGALVSRRFLPIQLSPKRSASLTGAIERGSRNARDVGRRTERHNSKFETFPKSRFTRDETRGHNKLGSYERQPERGQEAEKRRETQREPHRWEGRGSRGIKSRNARTEGREPSGRYPSRDADRTSSPLQPSSRDRFARPVDKYQDGPRYPRSFDDRTGQDRGYAGRSSSHQDDRPSFSRKTMTQESSFRGRGRDRTEPRYSKQYDEKTDQHRSSAERVTESEGETRPFHRKPQASEGYTLADNQEPTPEAEQESMRVKRHVAVPLAIPRSAAASEFIYGSSPVKAALQADTRKLYKLYIYQGPNGTEQRGGDKEVFKLAHKRDLNVKRVGGDELPLLDKMAQGRPHNGYVLEASQLPNTPAVALESVAGPGAAFSFTAGHQSAEELAVNGTSQEISNNSRRYPFVLMLDGILDPGNLGAILRSAAFFGVDAVALVDNTLAPFSSVTLKASSGAAEFMRYLKVKKDYDFVTKSQSNGWKFYAAVAPASASAGRGGPKVVHLTEAETALTKGPCVLMLGGEGEGLRPRLQKAADVMVGIEGARGLPSQVGLDSLNVSVAAALMMQTFLKAASRNADPEGSTPQTEMIEDERRLF